ncbi:MAG: GspE/PulE family protein [Patescibacteria group bacterium]|jgi:type IV pilus assembly protein PilB
MAINPSPNPSDKPSGDTPLIRKLIKNINRKEEERATQMLAKKFGVPYYNLVRYQPDPGAVHIIPKSLVETGHVFAFKKDGQDVHLAVSNLADPATIQALETLKKQSEYNFIPVMVSKTSLEYLISVYDEFVPKTIDQAGIKITAAEQTANAQLLKELNIPTASLQTAASTTQTLDTILGAATLYDASDIHIEPTKTAVHLRFRIDSVLQDMADLNINLLNSVINRIKLLADLKLNIRESAQDGRFSFEAGETSYDVRVSILPTAYGESAVLRLLPQKGKFITLDKLGLVGPNAEIIERVIQQPNGLILNTGPTGSGKTTTLYAILDKINAPGKKIITIEDPIEYKLAGITQSQVNPDEDYTFANGLRAILRQDPDVILVGEIRDADTANIAINASLTGHLVLSTLHTNDAAGAIPRLADLGLKPGYFIEAILAIIAQRLVRRLCSKCAEEYSPSSEELQELQQEMNSLPAGIDKPTIPTTLKRSNPDKAKTCDQCHGLGYKGILGIFEILQTNEALVKAVLAGATVGEIKKLAMANGMITLKQDGIIKVLQGITSLEEVNRITGQDTI